MNILILNWRDIRHPRHGGAEYVTHEHAKRWIQKGNHVTWFTTAYSGGKFSESIDGLHIIRKGSDLTVFFHAMLYVLTHRKDIDCIVDEVHGIPFFSVLYTRKPVVVFIHEIAGSIWDYMYPFPLAVVGKALEALYLCAYRSREFWTVSRSTALELKKKGIPKDHIVVIPNPISCAPVRSLPEKEKNPTFLYVGRLVRMKRVEDVVSAFAGIQKKKKTAMLWIAGTGDSTYISMLRGRIRSYGLEAHVRIFGYVGEKHKLQCMRRAHILLHASAKEGWGLVVLEAASQGTPSVVYDVAGLRDAVVHDKTGLLVQNGVPQDMAESALTLLSDKGKYRMFQENGLARVRELHWDSVAAASLTVLTRAVQAST